MIIEAKKEDLIPSLFKNYERYQKTTVLYRQNGLHLTIDYETFEEDWNVDDHQRICDILNYYIDQGGFVYLYMEDNQCIGFSGVNTTSINKMVNLGFLHVSQNYRGNGIGKSLFEATLAKCSEQNKSQIYLGAHPNKATIDFYLSLGFKVTDLFYEPVYISEKLDIQMIYDIKKSA